MVTLASRFYRLQYRSVQLYDQYTYTGHATADVRSAERDRVLRLHPGKWMMIDKRVRLVLDFT